MRLTSSDGAVVDLSLLRYQFGPSPEPRDWDANWLVVAGHVGLPDSRAWSFTTPCLTTWEAQELGSWLHEVRLGEVPPAPFGGAEDDLSLVLTEPNLAFSLAGHEVGRPTSDSISRSAPCPRGFEEPESLTSSSSPSRRS